MRRHALDLLIVFVALEGALEVVLRRNTATAPELSPWLGAPLVALLVLMLLARRRAPFLAPAGVWLLAAALSFVDGELVTFTVAVNGAGMAAAFFLGRLRDEVQGRLGLAIVVGCAAVVMYNDPGHAPADLVLLPAIFALAWLAGYALRERSVQAEAAEERARVAEREREAAARVAVAEERTRIARELHDSVAHAVSVMVLQVGAVRHRLPESLGEDVDALRGVEQAGRTALSDMRWLLGAMRGGEEAELAPQPGLDRLDALLEDVRRAGLPVELQVEGEPVALPGPIDLSAYRIVQEGLTNALKHAQASHAEVRIRYGGGELRIDVRDDGVGAGDGVGHGLVGVRERVKIYGGEMTAGSANGGFELSTRLPLS